MAIVNDLPQLVDKNRGSYTVIAHKLELGKFNKWKKRMLCYLAGMEPYYLKCIKDGSFQLKTAQGDAKPESKWTPEERRVVVQDQRLKSIIMSWLPDEIMESVISCVSAKETWTDLVHSFEGPSDTQENRIMDLKLKYQTFRAKSTESLSQTYTRYKTLLNELANDGVNLSKHEINISTGENSDDEVDERSSEEYLKDLDIEYQERALLANSKRFIKKETISQKDYKAEYKKMKAKLALFEASPSSSQNPKTFQPKNKGLVAETFHWDEEEVSDDEEVTQVKVLMALADDELTVGKSHAHNDEWVDITIRKKKVLGGELFTESSSKKNENENLFIPASMGILVPESQAVNESLESTETLNAPKSSKDSEAESLTPLPPLKIFKELHQA
ncbi:hypothetical protein Tco_1464872 [Tanacetum coccineum]